MVNKSIKIFLFVEIVIILTKFISFSFFMNLQIAFLSSFFIIMGSIIAHKRMVKSDIENENIGFQRDVLDEVEDPFELYDEEPINEAPVEELNLKEIVQEEKKKIKTFSAKSIKKGARAGLSIYRLIPYVFLILGFIALKNNELLDIVVYLPSILVGIVTAHVVGKELIS